MKTIQGTRLPARPAHGWRWLKWIVSLVVVTALLGAAPAMAQQWDRTVVKQALQATVEILVPDDNGDLFDTGSGTVLDAERGIILTNFHVMGDTDTRALFNKDGIAYIAVTPTDLKGAPVIRYKAQLIQGSPDDDLAVLKIVSLADDAPLPKNLGLIAVDRGNSEDLLPGDPLAVIGFPSLGGSTVTFTNGVVSGFLDENKDQVYEWIKTDAQVNPGNSGGLAIDQKGDFVGVPTAGYSQADVAGKISLIRPGTIALEFLDRAVLSQGGGKSADGQEIGGPLVLPSVSTTSKGSFGPITFASGVNDSGDAVDAGNTFVEANAIYAFFAVTGLQEGEQWRTRWLLDGEEVLKEDQTWSGGDVTSTWVSISHPDGLPEGQFTLELDLGDKVAQRGDFTIATRGQREDEAKAVNAIGLVHDADNVRKTISGALVVFLTPGITVDEWANAEFDESMVHASGTSARGGTFQLDNKVTPGAAYGIVVIHDDFKAIELDAYEIPADTGDPYELDVAMERN